MVDSREHELRCFCSKKPLLAVYGLDREAVFVHVRIYKAKRIFGEMFVTLAPGSIVKLACRECGRWHRVIIKQQTRAELSVDKPPTIAAATH